MDDFTKECLTVTVGFGILGVQVTRILDSIALFRGYPDTIRTDQAPELICKALASALKMRRLICWLDEKRDVIIVY